MSVHIEELGLENEISILMIHGAGGSSATWFMQLRGLSRKFYTVAIDLNGHGKTKDREESDTVESYLKDIEQIVGILDRPFLMGHSMGGMLAQLYALRYPDDLKGIILVGTGARLRCLPIIFDMLENDFESYVKAAAEYMFYKETSQKIIRASQAEIRKCKPSIITRDFYTCNEFDIMDTVQNITLPTLIIVGEDDMMTPVKYSTYLNEKIRGSSLKVIPKAGHSVMLERSVLFNQEVNSWISNL